MEKIIVELEAKTDKALKGIEKVGKEVEDLNKEVVGSNKRTEKSLKGVETASKSAAGGIKAIGTTLKAIGIGLLISALATLKEMFNQNQKAVDFFNVAFETAAIVVGQVVTAFVNVYEAVAKSSENFDALGKVVSGLITLGLTPLKLSFYAIKLAVQEAQLIWEKSFFGGNDKETIAELTLSILETKAAFSEVAEESVKAGADIINNFGEAITETVNIGTTAVNELGKISVKAALETAKSNVELTKSGEVAAAMQGLLYEQFDRQAEKLRQVRDEERNTIAERKKANDDLLIEIEKGEKAAINQAKIQLGIANANLTKDAKNVEYQVALIEAKKELAGIEAQFEGIRSEQKANDLALDRESIELINSKKDAEIELKNNKKEFNAELIEDELLKLERQKLNNELELEEETRKLTAKRENYKQDTLAYQEAQNELLAYQQANGQKQKTINNSIDKYKKNLEKTNLKRDKENNQAKEKIAMDSLGAIAGLLGQNSKFGKALAITSAIRDTYTGVNKAIAQGGIWGVVAGAGVLASGLANVKQITASQEPAAPSFATGGGGGGNVSTPAVPSLPPAFNIVGASNTNQLADAIGSQSQQPVQAYVVSNDVTTAQSLDRNIIEGASI